MTTIRELAFIETLTQRFKRSPLQLNSLQEADAEIVRLDPSGSTCLAITTDTIAEEISSGLYDDPFLIGWMTVMASMSDLAAVGATPIGILISETLPANLPAEWLSELQQGIAQACDACSSFVLGGDTNSGPQLILSGCAVGTTSQDRLLTRSGAQPGDRLYSTGFLGLGNAFALEQFVKSRRSPDESIMYQPHARLTEGRTVAGLASCCMDTSDGALSTLDQLMRVNHVGFEIGPEPKALLHPAARVAAELSGLPSWLFLAGQHGEFELLFTISPRDEARLLAAAERSQWLPMLVGTAISSEEIRLTLHGSQVALDTGALRNLAGVCGSDVESYIRELCCIDAQYEKGVLNHVYA